MRPESHSVFTLMRPGPAAFLGGCLLALPTSIAAPRHRSGAERLAEQLGGEDKLRKLLAAIASAMEMGGTTRLEFESRAGSGQVMQHRLLHGGPLW